MKYKIKKRIMVIIMIIVALLFLIYTTIYILVHNTKYGNDFSSSFTKSQFLCNKTIMIIVPHEDDEMHIAGASIKNFIAAKDNVIIVYATNGDYFTSAKTRINEAIAGAKVLGIPEKNLIFLGYGDQWETQYKHIYYAPDDDVVASHAKKTATYGTKSHKDFRTSISGKSSSYTRNNYKKDLKDVILKYKPDMIIASDFDFHPDHRALSLLFEEAIDEILKSDTSYNPIVFKAFAYNTSYGAKDDFYSSLNLESTVLPIKNKLNDSNYELDVPSYNWTDRIRFPVSSEVLSYTKSGSIIDKVFSKYKSQEIQKDEGRVINSDQVFWKRKTTSLTYKANITVSSGQSKYLNDFKFIDCSNIEPKTTKIDNCVWIPDKTDTKKTVRITFKEPKDISYVSLYDNFSLTDNILKSTLTFSDGSVVNVGNLNKNGSETIVNFDTKKNISYIEYKINEWEGDNPGLCEIEAYSKAQDETPQYIKIMLNNDNKTFIYKYLVTTEKTIPIDIYTYPVNNNGTNLSKCKIYIKSSTDGNVTLNGNNIVIKDTSKKEKYILRAELINNPNIYDEVEIEIPSKSEMSYINSTIKIEKTCNNIERKVHRFNDKVMNIIKIPYRYAKKHLKILKNK